MRRQLSITTLLEQIMHGNRIEPIKRVKCLYHVKRGRRNLPERPRHVAHTYAIKGGISNSDLMLENISANNALFQRLHKK